MAVLNQVLGGGLSSRLFQEIREKRGLAYSIYSERVAYHDAGTLSVYVGTSPDRAGEVLRLVNQELDRMTDGISGAELELAIGHLRSELLLSQEDSGARMGRLGRSLLLHHEVLSLEEIVDRIRSVTRPEVKELAERVLAGTRTTAAVGPFENGLMAELGLATQTT